MKVNTFDIDGVIYLGPDLTGVFPGPNDFIVTGRSVDEAEYTETMLAERGIKNKVFFNPIPFEQKSRETSGIHKARVIRMLREQGYEHGVHFEDDPVQIGMIQSIDSTIKIVHLDHNLVELENVWHGENPSKEG